MRGSPAFVASAIGVAGLLLAACGREPQPPTDLPVLPFATSVVQPEQARREQIWDGVVEAVDDTTIAAQTNARVLELPHDVGDRVAKGDVLVRFSDVEQKSGQRAAVANVSVARAEYRSAEANWKRVDDIVGKGLMARADLDAATGVAMPRAPPSPRPKPRCVAPASRPTTPWCAPNRSRWPRWRR